MANCPHCNQMISRLNLQEMTSSALFGQEWRTIAYVCPMCQKIISTQIDPIAIKFKARVSRLGCQVYTMTGPYVVVRLGCQVYTMTGPYVVEK